MLSEETAAVLRDLIELGFVIVPSRGLAQRIRHRLDPHGQRVIVLETNPGRWWRVECAPRLALVRER